MFYAARGVADKSVRAPLENEIITNRNIKGKKIFFIGRTGFVGKVTLSMLLRCWSSDTLVRTNAASAFGENVA